MPVLNPVVTKLTSASTAITDYMSALFTHFGTSTKFNIVANGGVADAFTVTPSGSETWHVNLRNINPTTTITAIDPLGNITNPGVAGGLAPTLTDDSEWSNETSTMQIAGTESLDFYVIELDDAFIVLFMDSAKTHTPRGMHYGRAAIPYFTDGVNGNDYCDGLGMFGHIPRVTSSSGAGFWVSSSANESRFRGFQNYVVTPGDQWFEPSVFASPSTSDRSDINGNKKIFPATFSIELKDAAGPGSAEYTFGYPKYWASQNTPELPGVVLDGGSGNDAWVHVYDSNTTSVSAILLPWDRLVTPEF